jgi:hypothetical protein
MENLITRTALTALLALAWAAVGSAEEEKAPAGFSWKQDSASVALVGADGKMVWRFNYADTERKAEYFRDRSGEDKVIVERTRRLERFFSQPFAVASAFTGLPGKYVTREETVRSFKEVVEGKWDHLPLEAFRYVGNIDEAVEKAERLKKEAGE